MKSIEIFCISLILIIMVLSSGCTGSMNFLPVAEDCGDGGKCPEGYACDTDGKCYVCGNADLRVCCEGNECEEGLICINGKCNECGNEWKYCCDGDKCDENCVCGSDERCHCCGWVGEVCCEGGTCNDESFYCGSDGKCHGCFGVNDTDELSQACGSRG